MNRDNELAQDLAEVELLTQRETARLFRVATRTVGRWADQGKLSAARTPGGHRRYLKSQVLALLAATDTGKEPLTP